MKKYGLSLCHRLLAMLLGAVVLVSAALTPAFATEVTEPSAVVETTDSAQEGILPECDCGCAETDLDQHGETCVRKVFSEVAERSCFSKGGRTKTNAVRKSILSII